MTAVAPLRQRVDFMLGVPKKGRWAPNPGLWFLSGLLAGACGDARPAATRREAADGNPVSVERVADVYRSLMKTLADEALAKVDAATRAPPTSYRQARQALLDVLPVRMLADIEPRMEQLGISSAQLAGLGQERPGVVREAGIAFDQKVLAADEQLRGLTAHVLGLAPPQDDTASVLKRMGYGRLLPPGGAVIKWIEVGNREALSAAVQTAHQRGKGVLLEFSAAWCLPCRELETKTFADPRVVAQVNRAYESVRFDVTEPGEVQQRLQASFGAKTLPSVSLFRNAAALGEALVADRPPPAASVQINVFVEPDEFLERLAAARATVVVPKSPPAVKE